MAEAFYPFVENGAEGTSSEGETLQVRQSARIAVYDDLSAAPRVVVVEPSDIRSYLEEITATVTRLAAEQGGRIPFTVIREVVENLIHAYFIEPTISILDGGNTIRFSDQGPGIVDKSRALQFGTTSATTEMKRYIRGVGSGLPYAQQWLEDKGGSLTVEDNIHNGTVVTVSLVPSTGADAQAYPQTLPSTSPFAQGLQQQAAWPQPQPQPPAGWPQQPQPQAWPQQTWATQPAYQQPWNAAQQMPQQPMGYGQSTYQQPAQAYAAPMPQTYPQQAAGAGAPQVTPRGAQALEFLRMNPSVGPSDLVAAFGESAPTWSRELKTLETQGLLSKQGQKRQLTPLGRQYLGL